MSARPTSAGTFWASKSLAIRPSTHSTTQKMGVMTMISTQAKTASRAVPIGSSRRCTSNSESRMKSAMTALSAPIVPSTEKTQGASR
ncbi:MAG: hypothetical protein F4X25_03605 [Chloroflexi bacterium]|nr:hypothetical protein [Chloroflexota bacterium]